mgnify:CR=1 FL=1
MLITPNSVDVVTVTYGERWNYLKKVIKQVERFDEVNSIIVVDNASTYSVRERINKELGTLKKNIIVIRSEFNLGSAGGYKKGIQKALEEQGTLIWLLDDDNFPNDNAMRSFILAQEELPSSEDIIFCSFRDDREELIKNKGQKLYKNTFFEFSLYKKIGEYFKKYNQQSESDKILHCDYVPYGGLLFPKKVIAEVGLPYEAFYLYVDDIDFTYRMTKKGYKIYCIVESVIQDLEKSWFRKEKEPMFLSFFKADNTYRGLMHIRNRVYFEVNNNKTNSFIYYTNMLVYLIYVFIKYMPKNREGFKRYFSILKAIRLGRKGILGNEIK